MLGFISKGRMLYNEELSKGTVGNVVTVNRKDLLNLYDQMYYIKRALHYGTKYNFINGMPKKIFICLKELGWYEDFGQRNFPTLSGKWDIVIERPFYDVFNWYYVICTSMYDCGYRDYENPYSMCRLLYMSNDFAIINLEKFYVFEGHIIGDKKSMGWLRYMLGKCNDVTENELRKIFRRV